MKKTIRISDFYFSFFFFYAYWFVNVALPILNHCLIGIDFLQVDSSTILLLYCVKFDRHFLNVHLKIQKHIYFVAL